MNKIRISHNVNHKKKSKMLCEKCRRNGGFLVRLNSGWVRMKCVVLVYAEMRRHVAGQQSHSCSTTEREERCRLPHPFCPSQVCVLVSYFRHSNETNCSGQAIHCLHSLTRECRTCSVADFHLVSVSGGRWDAQSPTWRTRSHIGRPRYISYEKIRGREIFFLTNSNT
jgi:hypothetical protein